MQFSALAQLHQIGFTSIQLVFARAPRRFQSFFGSALLRTARCRSTCVILHSFANTMQFLKGGSFIENGWKWQRQFCLFKMQNTKNTLEAHEREHDNDDAINFVYICQLSAMILMQRSNQNNAPDSPSSSCAKSFSFNITAFQIDCLIIVLEFHSVSNSTKKVS